MSTLLVGTELREVPLEGLLAPLCGVVPHFFSTRLGSLLRRSYRREVVAAAAGGWPSALILVGLCSDDGFGDGHGEGVLDSTRDWCPEASPKETLPPLVREGPLRRDVRGD